MGFQPPVPQKDTDWEIRAAVLASLAIQVFLIFVAPLRRRSASRFPRFVVWSCYLLADWVADLCLGLLLNSLGNIGAPAPAPSATPNSGGSGTSSPVIFAFWAPFLLLHLGGPDTITAFSVEDNELWLRHLIGLLFELSAAAVVFFCSLRGNPFIVASVFMFIVGIVKYAERTYCLYRGSADGLRSSMLGDPDPGSNYTMIMDEYDAKRKAGLHADIYLPMAPDAASADTTVDPKFGESHPVESTAFQLYQTFQCLFADLILSFNERKVSQEFFSRLDAHKAFELIEVELGFVYDIIYTKAAVVHRRVGYALRLIGSACIVTALLSFLFVDKRGFRLLDVVITYALLVGAVVLDAAAFVMLLSSDWTRVFCAAKPFFKKCCLLFIKNNAWLGLRRRRRRWSQKVSRLSLIRYCLDEPVRASLLRVCRLASCLADKLRVKEFLDETFYVRREEVSEDLKKFVFDKLKAAAKETSEADGHENINKAAASETSEADGHENINEAAAASETSVAKGYEKIKEVCERRGAGALKKLELELKLSDDPEHKKYGQELMKYVKVDFDQSLLLWHIATELCHNDDKTTQRQTDQETEEKNETKETKQQRSISMEVSEYLVYLLVMRPAMLSTAAGIGLLRYRDTCAEARRFFRMFGRGLNGDKKRSRLTSVNTEVEPVKVKGDRSKSVLFDACILSKELNKLKEKKWEVVSGVWAEMLVYAAYHCRAAGHVRQLGSGGEFATVVWLLMAHVGLGQLYQIQSGDARANLIVQK